MLSKQYYVTLHHKIGRVIFVCCTVPGTCSFPFSSTYLELTRMLGEKKDGEVTIIYLYINIATNKLSK